MTQTSNSANGVKSGPDMCVSALWPENTSYSKEQHIQILSWGVVLLRVGGKKTMNQYPKLESDIYTNN